MKRIAGTVSEGVVDPEATARAALQAAGLGGGRLALLGTGGDAVTFVRDQLVIAVRQAGNVSREAAVLEHVAGLQLPLQTPRAVFVDDGAGVLVTTLVPGRSLLDREPPAGTGDVLGRLLTCLHSAQPDVPHIEREPFDFDEWISDLTGPAPLVARTLEDAPSVLAGELVLSHGDLGAEHLFTTGDHVTGLVDWGDAGVMDRAVDFARILRDFGPRVLEEALDAYVAASEVDRQAVTFFARCAALEDLGYAAATGRAAYGYAAQRSLTWLFPGAPALSTGLPGEASRWHNSQESC